MADSISGPRSDQDETPSLATLLGTIDNALRNGSWMTKANLAFDLLCDRLNVNRHHLTFDPEWTRRRIDAMEQRITRDEVAARQHALWAQRPKGWEA